MLKIFAITLILLSINYSFSQIVDLPNGKKALSITTQDGEKLGILLDDNLKNQSGFQILSSLQQSSFLKNSCGVMASNSDMDYLYAREYYKSYAGQQLGCGKASDADFNNHKYDQWGCFTCLTMGKAQFSNPSPAVSTKIIGSGSFTNTLNQVTPHTFTFKNGYQESCSVSNTQTTSFSVSEGFSIEAGIDEVAKVKWDFSISTTMSSSQTNSQTNSYSTEFDDATSVNVQPGQCVAVNQVADLNTWDMDYTASQCVEGYVQVNYGGQCNGHHYWFVPVYDAEEQYRCRQVKGKLGANVAIKSHVQLTDCKKSEGLFLEKN